MGHCMVYIVEVDLQKMTHQVRKDVSAVHV